MLILVLAVIVSVFLWMAHINRLRAEMESHLAGAYTQLEQGACCLAQIDAEAALVLARRLRDNETIDETNTLIRLASTISRSDELFDDGLFQEALEGYLLAADISSGIDDLNTGFLDEKIAVTEMYLVFFMLIENAENFAEASNFNAALALYEEAKSIASALSFDDGVTVADSGIADVQERIIIAKLAEASDHFYRGEQLFNDGMYVSSIVYYRNALEIYLELDDTDRASVTASRIDLAERRIAELSLPELPVEDDPQDDTGGQVEFATNYEYNLSLSFDMSSLIDDQRQSPANQIRMGSTDGRNEGWYNGCGWVATYNALILLGTPEHPADIVRHFETSGGTVLGGMFGTYPNAIEAYLRSMGYPVNHTLFPQLTLDIDAAVKASRVSILAYMHTSAAHYITIEYRQDIDKFIVYNDSFARARSASLGYQNETNVGAAIDSVTALIRNTPDILFVFSLITVN